MFKELGEPVLLTAKVAERPDLQQRFYISIGLVKMPVRWQDDEQKEYEVYVWGEYADGHLCLRDGTGGVHREGDSV